MKYPMYMAADHQLPACFP